MEFRDAQPIYLQIADYVCERVLQRKWKQEDRIPSVRELAVLLEVNPNTIMRAYEFLQQKDILTNQRGVGLFVSVKGVENATDYRRIQFMEKELPAFFQSMTLLQIEPEELQILFKKFKRVKI